MFQQTVACRYWAITLQTVLDLLKNSLCSCLRALFLTLTLAHNSRSEFCQHVPHIMLAIVQSNGPVSKLLPCPIFQMPVNLFMVGFAAALIVKFILLMNTYK